jgi:uncharacterized protein (TIGR00369 family)
MVDFNEQELLEGLNGHLGFRIDAWREGYAEISVELDDCHRNRQGGVHGGTMTALIDAATGFCGVYEPDREKRRGNATVSLTVNFVGRPKGTTLTCAARVIRAGRRIYFSSAEVKDDQDNLVATAEAVYAYVDRK